MKATMNTENNKKDRKQNRINELTEAISTLKDHGIADDHPGMVVLIKELNNLI